jgi:hypothetical protein
MKKRTGSSKSLKKYGNGGGKQDPPNKKVGTFRDNKTGTYEYTGEYNTPAGKRYYSATSPDYSIANQIADFKARTQSKDSIPSSRIIKNKMGGTTKMKKGGSVKKMKMGGSCGTPKSLRKGK